MKKSSWLLLIAVGLLKPLIAHSALEYSPGSSYGKAENLPEVSSLAVGKNDFLVVAAKNKVLFYDPANEKSVRSFDSGFGEISAIAFEGDTIYVFSRKKDTVEREYNGRKYKQEVPVQALCKKFTWEGQPAGELELKDLKDAINAKVVDGILYVADFGGTHKIRSFDAKTGKPIATIGENLRLCCGILDFAIDPKSKDVLIPNLGAFKLERYNAQGKLANSFGQRGDKLEQFQGCCNPVSASVLPDGNLVVVEKDPSRVKVYSADGTMLASFDKLANLVKGCGMVSVASDSKGRVYLGVNAEKDRFVLQYTPKL
jgi:hypothetical protein